MQDLKVIGFGYKKRVGKDTAARFALSHLRQQGFNAQRCSFFDPIKHHAFQLYKWGGLMDGAYYEDHPSEKETILPPIGKSPRQIYDELGSTLHNLCPKTLPEIAFSRAVGNYLVIPDVRRPIEVEYIHKFGGRVIRIDRPDAPISTHPVDNMLNDFSAWDGVIMNNGSLKEFIQKVQGLFNG